MMTCETCKYWKPVEASATPGRAVTIGKPVPRLGQCCRKAPQAVVPVVPIPVNQVGAMFNFQGGATSWPITGSMEGCGEHAPETEIGHLGKLKFGGE